MSTDFPKIGRLSSVVAITANGAVVSILSVAYAITTATFVFSGALQSGIGYAVASALAATAISGVILAWGSDVPSVIGGVDSRSAAALAVALAPLAAMAGTLSVATALMASTLATIVTAILMFVLGRVQAGRLIRFMPYPVIGAVSAGSGILMLESGVRMVLTHVDIAVAGLLFSALLIALERWRGAMPVTAAVAVAMLFPALAHRFGMPLDVLRNGGWLLSAPPVTLWLPWTHLQSVSWPSLVRELPALIAVAAISAISVLFNAASLEKLANRDIDMDKQLNLSAATNAAGAFVGAMISFTSFSRSAMNHNAGTRTRIVGYIVSAAALLFIVAGGGVLQDIPVFVPAALLISAGVTIAFEWLVTARNRVSTADLITIWLMVAFVVLYGFVAAIVAGVIMTCMTFAARYARTDAIERRGTLVDCHSTFERSIRETEVLAAHGDRADVYFLRGWLFFGVAEPIYQQLMMDSDPEQPRWIVVDFSAVTGMDSSAAHMFLRLLRNNDPSRVHVRFSGMRDNVLRLWNRLPETEVHRVPLFSYVDEALEWCENDLLRGYDSYVSELGGFDLWLIEQFGAEYVELLAHMRRIELQSGDALCLAGDHSDTMFIIESGRVAIIVGDEAPMRVRSLGSHTFIGEAGFYRGRARNASVVAEAPTIAYELSRDTLDWLESTNPDLARAIHASMIRTLADRLEYQTSVTVFALAGRS